MNRVVLLTRAAQGIGKAIARRLAAQVEAVVLTDINEALLHDTESEMRESAQKCSSYVLDVSRPGEVKKAVQDILAEEGRIDVLVNNAGIAAFGSLQDVTDELLDRMLGVNFKGALCFSAGKWRPQ